MSLLTFTFVLGMFVGVLLMSAAILSVVEWKQ